MAIFNITSYDLKTAFQASSPKEREFERTSICHGSLVEIEIFKEGGVVDAYYK